MANITTRVANFQVDKKKKSGTGFEWNWKFITVNTLLMFDIYITKIMSGKVDCLD